MELSKLFSTVLIIVILTKMGCQGCKNVNRTRDPIDKYKETKVASLIYPGEFAG